MMGFDTKRAYRAKVRIKRPGIGQATFSGVFIAPSSDSSPRVKTALRTRIEQMKCCQRDDVVEVLELRRLKTDFLLAK